MFIPQKFKLKYKKYHRAHIVSRTSKVINFSSLKKGSIGLKILQFGFITSKQLISVYSLLNKALKKKASIYYYAFAKDCLTTKKEGARMGKGKGKAISAWIYKVKAGFILCEIHTSLINIAIKALKKCQFKLPLISRIIVNKFTNDL